MAGGIDLKTATDALEGPLTDLYNAAKGAAKSYWAPFATKAKMKVLYKKIATVEKVKTIWQVDKEIKLRAFYYPSRINFESKPLLIEYIKQIPYDGNIIISGIVGQGKSIFLRYLCIKELNLGERIPIFFELRKIKPQNNLTHYMKEVLSELGFNPTSQVLSHIFSSGKAVILFDGFDEVDSSLMPDVINDIEHFTKTYPRTQIVITSRPDSPMRHSAQFRIFPIQPLTTTDHPEILKKLISSQEDRDEILKALKSDPGSIRSLLTTPLMITLLVIYFRKERKLPNRISEFYDQIFPTLYFRHDNTKPGFKRRRQSSISEYRARELFEGLCYGTKSIVSNTYSMKELVGAVDQAATILSIEGVDAEKFIVDIRDVTNLIIEESSAFHFIHKSVLEYHAAAFIKHRHEVAASSFYESMVNGKWNKWQEELEFLKEIDLYRYTKHYKIPSLKMVFQGLEVTAYEYGAITREAVEKASKCFLHQFAEKQFQFGTMYNQETINISFGCQSFNEMARKIHDKIANEALQNIMESGPDTFRSELQQSGIELTLVDGMYRMGAASLWGKHFGPGSFENLIKVMLEELLSDLIECEKYLSREDVAII